MEDDMRIIVDMDGTIADFTTASFKKVEELYGIKMTKEDAYKPKTAQLVWERMTPEQKSKYGDHRELYGEICDVGFFEKIKPFEGAIEEIKRMNAAGGEICFVTKVLNWDRSAQEKDRWLKKYFHDMKYYVLMVDSVHSKQCVEADFIIDDDPRVLADIKGPIPIMMKQPWNANTRGVYPFEVDTVKEAVDIVLQYKESLRWWDQEGMRD
jgi:5'(3')-deoxyribonucleotidase